MKKLIELGRTGTEIMEDMRLLASTLNPEDESDFSLIRVKRVKGEYTDDIAKEAESRGVAIMPSSPDGYFEIEVTSGCGTCSAVDCNGCGKMVFFHGG